MHVGMYLLALAVPGGVNTWFGPLLLTIALFFAFGVPTTDNFYKDNEEFKAYMKRTTSSIFPMHPKQLTVEEMKFFEMKQIKLR